MSTGWIEQRLKACEERLEYLIRYIQDLVPQLRAAAQSARTAGATYGSSGGSSGGTYYCMPSSGVAAATGTWPALTPQGFTADVYTTAGSGITLSMASAQCWNFIPSPLVASKVVFLAADGTGDFDTVTQSCQ
jgi:hypothetical protein